MLNFEFRSIDENTASQLMELSRLWVEEDCCAGMVVNEVTDLQEPLVVALEGNRIVGYLFGHYYQQPHNSSYAPKDAK